MKSQHLLETPSAIQTLGWKDDSKETSLSHDYLQHLCTAAEGYLSRKSPLYVAGSCPGLNNATLSVPQRMREPLRHCRTHPSAQAVSLPTHWWLCQHALLMRPRHVPEPQPRDSFMTTEGNIKLRTTDWIGSCRLYLLPRTVVTKYLNLSGLKY